MSIRSDKNLFELEALEPRTLLSADPLALAVAPAITPEQLLSTINGSTIEQPQTQVSHPANEGLAYDADAQVNDIFGGLEDTLPSPLSPAENEAENTRSEDAAPQADAASETNSTELSGEQTLMNSSSTADQDTTPVSASNEQVNPFAEQSVDTLNAANGPPQSLIIQLFGGNLASPNVYTLLLEGASLVLVNENGDILFSGLLEKIASLRILGQDGKDDSFLVDYNLLDLASPPPIEIEGRSGIDSLEVLGHAGASRMWLINGPDTGTLANITFRHIENLVGGANDSDTFVVAAGGSLSGVIDGGVGGYDTLVLTGGSFSTVVYSFTSPDSGTIMRDSNVVTYAGLEPINDNSPAIDRILSFTKPGVILTISADPNSHSIKIQSNQSETLFLTSPSNSLTINTGTDDDEITILSLGSDFGAKLVINAGAGNDSFTVGGCEGKTIGLQGGDGDDTYKLKDGFGNLTISELVWEARDTLDYSALTSPVLVYPDGKTLVSTDGSQLSLSGLESLIPNSPTFNVPTIEGKIGDVIEINLKTLLGGGDSFGDPEFGALASPGNGIDFGDVFYSQAFGGGNYQQTGHFYFVPRITGPGIGTLGVLQFHVSVITGTGSPVTKTVILDLQPGYSSFMLQGSVGGSGATNRFEDVLRVQQRLRFLNFRGIKVNEAGDVVKFGTPPAVEVTGHDNAVLRQAISLFQAVIQGDGKGSPDYTDLEYNEPPPTLGPEVQIAPNSPSNFWLNADNAPYWIDTTGARYLSPGNIGAETWNTSWAQAILYRVLALDPDWGLPGNQSITSLTEYPDIRWPTGDPMNPWNNGHHEHKGGLDIDIGYVGKFGWNANLGRVVNLPTDQEEATDGQLTQEEKQVVALAKAFLDASSADSTGQLAQLGYILMGDGNQSYPLVKQSLRNLGIAISNGATTNDKRNHMHVSLKPPTIQLSSFNILVQMGDVAEVNLGRVALGASFAPRSGDRLEQANVVVGQDHRVLGQLVYSDLMTTKLFFSSGTLYFVPALDADLTQAAQVSITIAGKECKIVFHIQDGSSTFTLSGSVGAGGQNKILDVYRVQQRLRYLGFPSASGAALVVDGNADDSGNSVVNENDGTVQTIKLFQAAVRVKKGVADPDDPHSQDGLISKGGTTLGWLNSKSSPRWVKLADPDGVGGLFDLVPDDSAAQVFYATDWMTKLIEAATKGSSETQRLELISENGYTDEDGHRSGMGLDVGISYPEGMGDPNGAGTISHDDIMNLSVTSPELVVVRQILAYGASKYAGDQPVVSQIRIGYGRVVRTVNRELGKNLAIPDSDFMDRYSIRITPPSLNVNMPGGVVTVLRSAASGFSKFGSMVTGAFSGTNVAALLGDPTINQLLHSSPGPDMGDFLDLGRAIKAYFDAVEQTGESPTYEGLAAAVSDYLLSLWGDKAQGRLEAGPVSVSGGFFEDTGQMRFDVLINMSKVKSLGLDVNALGAVLGLNLSASVPLEMDVSLTVAFSFGVDLNRFLADPNYAFSEGDVFFTLKQFTMGALVQTDALDFGMNMGSFGLNVVGGAMELNVSAEVAMTDSTPSDGRLSFQDITNGTFTLSTTPSASLAVSLPIFLDIPGANVRSEASILMTDDDLFTGPPPSVTAEGSFTVDQIEIGSFLSASQVTLSFTDNGRRLGISANSATVAFGSLLTGSVMDGPDIDTLAISGEYELDTDVFTLDVDQASLTITNFVTVSGSFEIEKSADKIKVGASNVSAFLGTADESMGISISNGSLGLMVYSNDTYAMEGAGAISLVGFGNALSLQGNVGIRVNTTGAELNESIPVRGPPAQPLEVKFGPGEGNFNGVTGVRLVVLDLIELQGNFSFTKTESAGATKIKVGATAVSGFLGTSDQKMGLRIMDANLGLVLFKDSPIATPVYALETSSSLEVVGLEAIQMSGRIGVRVNTTGRSVDESIPDSANLVFTNGTNLFGIYGQNVTLGISGVLELSGNFGFTKTVSGQTTKLVIGATDVSVTNLFGKLDPNIGDGLSHGKLGLVVFYDNSKNTTTGSALVAFGSATVHGAITATATVKVRRNSMATPVSETVDVIGGTVPVVFSGTEVDDGTKAFLSVSVNDFSLSIGDFIHIVGDTFTTSGSETTVTGARVDFMLPGLTEPLLEIIADLATYSETNGSKYLTISAGSLSIGSLVTISGSVEIDLPKGATVTNVHFGTAAIGLSINGREMVRIDGSIDFHYSGQDGLTLDSWAVTNFSLLGKQVLPVGALAPLLEEPKAGPKGVTNPRYYTYHGDYELANFLTLTNPGIGLLDFSFGLDGSNPKLTIKVAVGVESAILHAGPVTLNISDAADPDRFGIAGRFDITGVLDPANDFRPIVKPTGFMLDVDQLSAEFGEFLTLSASNLEFDPSARSADPMLTVTGNVGATIHVSSWTIGGSAGDFTILGDGSFQANKDFSVILYFSGSTANDLKWPDWLPIQISNLGLSWPDFSADPLKFKLLLSATVTDFFNTASAGLQISGGVTGLVIDPALLAEGKFPFTDLSGFEVSIKGPLFGANVEAALSAGIVKIDKNTYNVLEDTATGPNVERVFYAAMIGDMSFANIEMSARAAFSSRGPLAFYVKADFPILLDPITGLTLSGLRGGVEFSKTIPTPADAFALRDKAFAPPGEKDIFTWTNELKQQIATQVKDNVTFSDPSSIFNSPMVISAGANFYSSYTTQDVFRAETDLSIDTTGKILINAKSVYGDTFKSRTYFYGDLSKITKGEGRFLFLVDMPEKIGSIDPLYTIYGEISFGYVDSTSGDTVSGTTLQALLLTPDRTDSFSGGGKNVFELSDEPSALGTVIVKVGGARTTDFIRNGGTLTLTHALTGTQTLDVTYQVDGQTVVDKTTVTTSTSVFKLSSLPSAASTLVVVKNGAELTVVTDYSLDQSTWTVNLSNAAAKDDRIEIRYGTFKLTSRSNPPVSDYTYTFRISISGGVRFNLPGDTYAQAAGQVVLSFGGGEFHLQISAAMEISLFGTPVQLGTVGGEFVVRNMDDQYNAWGAVQVNIEDGLSGFLKGKGFTATGIARLSFNSDNVDHAVTLRYPKLGAEPPYDESELADTSLTLKAYSFSILMEAQAAISIPGTGTELFSMHATFFMQITSARLEIFAEGSLTLAPGGVRILTFMANGLLVITSGGMAGRMSMVIGGSLMPGVTMGGAFHLTFNTTGDRIEFPIPELPVPIPMITGPKVPFDSDHAEATQPYETTINGVRTIVIPGGAPDLSNPNWNPGDWAPPSSGFYLIVFGGGHVTLGSVFEIKGALQLLVAQTSGGLEVRLELEGKLDLGIFGNFQVQGGGVIKDGFLAMRVALGANVLSGIPGIHISGDFTFEINTGGKDVVINGVTVPHDSFLISIAAQVEIFNVFHAAGGLVIRLANGILSIEVNNLEISFFRIVDIGISGYIRSDGSFSLSGELRLNLTVGGGLSKFGIKGGLGVTIKNSGISGWGSVSLVVTGIEIDIASAELSVDWRSGTFKIRAEAPLGVWLEVTGDRDGFHIDGGLGPFNILGFVNKVIEYAKVVGKAVADAAEAVGNAIEDLGKAILDFGSSVVDFVGGFITDLGDLIGNVIHTIGGWFESSRTEVEDLTGSIQPYYSYSWRPLEAGKLTIDNREASKLFVAVVDGNLIVDAPDVTKSVPVAKIKHFTRHFEVSWRHVGWSDWEESDEYRYENVTFSNTKSFTASEVSQIVINGINSAETIIFDRNTINIGTTVYGNGGNDVILGGSGNDTVYGGDGNDTIFTFGGDDTIYGEGGNDTIMGGTGNDTVYGGAGNDVLDESYDEASPYSRLGERNTLDGGSDEDKLLGSSGTDTLLGGDNNDFLMAYSDTKTIGGGADDTIVYDGWGKGNAFGDNEDGTGVGFDIVVVTGTDSSDDLRVSRQGVNQVRVSSYLGSAEAAYVVGTSVEELDLAGGGGADKFSIDGRAGLETVSAIKIDLGTNGDASSDGAADEAFITLSEQVDEFSFASSKKSLAASWIDAAGKETAFEVTHGQLSDGDELQVYALAGDDLLNAAPLDSLHVARVEFHAGDGDDTINVGSSAPRTGGAMNGLDGLLRVDGGRGFDVLNLDDTGETRDISGALTAATVTGLGMGEGVVYVELEELNIALGAGIDTFTAHSTHEGLTNIDGGASGDVIRLEDASGTTNIYGGAGEDEITVDTLESLDTATTGDTVNLNGEAGSDAYTVNISGFGAYIVNILDTGEAGYDTLAVNGTTASDDFLLRASEHSYDGGIAFVAALHDNPVSGVERINYNKAIEYLTADGGAGADRFTLDDNWVETTIRGGEGDDTFQVGQIFKTERDAEHANIAAKDEFETVRTTRGYLSNGVSYATRVEGNSGRDHFIVFRNKAALNLLGGDGDDDFSIRAFALEGSHTTELSGEGGADYVEYVINSPVRVLGGEGSDTLKVIGTEFSDQIVITAFGIYGMGVSVSYGEVEHIEVDGAEGNDIFYVLSTAAGVETRLYGGLGSDRFSIGGDVPRIISGSTEIYPATNGPHTVAGIQGALFIEGMPSKGSAGGLGKPIMLPGETNEPPMDGEVQNYAGTGLLGSIDRITVLLSDLQKLIELDPALAPNNLADFIGLTLEISKGPGLGRFWLILDVQAGVDGMAILTLKTPTVPGDEWSLPDTTSKYAVTYLASNFFILEDQQVDFATVYNDGARADQSGVLTATSMTGLGMGAAGITYGSLEVLDIFLGSGNDTFVVSGTMNRADAFRTVTMLNTGAGGDSITVSLNAGVDGFFALNTELGDDQISAASSTLPLVIFGGEGNDTIVTGSGDDVLFGDFGRIDYRDATGRLVTRLGLDLEERTVLQPGELEISEEDIPFKQTDGVIYNPVFITTREYARGGMDRIFSNGGNDIIFGGAVGDIIHGGAGDDLIVGDNGVLDFTTGGKPTMFGKIYSTNPTVGGNDSIYGDADEDIILGGWGDDSLDGGSERDLIFGDNVSLIQTDYTNPRFRTLIGTELYGRGQNVNGYPGGQVLVTAPGAQDPLGHAVWADLRITFSALGNGNDYIAGGAGDDMIFGQLGNDIIQGDGSIDWGTTGNRAVRAYRNSAGLLTLNPSFDAAGDGDDYIEGNGGNDVIFGNLGQDDIIGGNSSLFSLVSPNQRPDSSDLIFGGSGTAIMRNDDGDMSTNGHANDSDMILGDNGNIYHIVGTGGAAGAGFGTFNYDNYGTLRIVVRAAELLDYTPGGPDFNPTKVGSDPSKVDSDIGAGDEIHGESGDDFIYGMVGNDVLYGDGQDDDIIGGYGNDWISGGTGDDGILGDDGRIFTSRNGLTEPLNGLGQAVQQSTISTPGNIQQAVSNQQGLLAKTVDMNPYNLDPATIDDPMFGPKYADDIIYGGLGNDFLHGGAGDDAISGAEALPVTGAGTPVINPANVPADGSVVISGLMVSGFDRPYNPGNILLFNENDTNGKNSNRKDAGEFALYDEFNPLRRITLTTSAGVKYDFLLNFNAAEGPMLPGGSPQRGDPYDAVNTDGDDKIFGDLGNDWLVGGTGRDDLYGGWGNDLLNADDDQSTNNSLNNGPDTHPSYEDRAFGGAGRDVLIANTGGDRLIDWSGEFNSYLVPFSPFGVATVSRSLQPGLQQFLYDLSKSDGADQTLAIDTGSDPARNGEPNGELGMVLQHDDAWNDQHGGPADPQAGNTHGSKRDVLRSAAFAQGQANILSPDSGNWKVTNDRYQASPVKGADAVSLIFLSDELPSYAEIQATINANQAKTGVNSNAYIIFDYQSSTDFKFAGVDVALGKMVIGQRTQSEWISLAETNLKLAANTDYTLQLILDGTKASLRVDGNHLLERSFGALLNSGMLGVGTRNAVSRFDDVTVLVAAPIATLAMQDGFSGKLADQPDIQTGNWQVTGGRYEASLSTGFESAFSIWNLNPGVYSSLQFDTAIKTLAYGGLIFDYRSELDFKFAAILAGSNQVVIGHHTDAGWYIDAGLNYTIRAGTEYQLSATLQGTNVSVSINGNYALNYSFSNLSYEGGFGLFTLKDSSSFDFLKVTTFGI